MSKVNAVKNAQSRMDFLNKLNIALKEANETEYWLDLLHETQYLDDKQYTSLNDDCIEPAQDVDSSHKKAERITFHLSPFTCHLNNATVTSMINNTKAYMMMLKN